MMLVAPLVEKQEIVPRDHQWESLEFLLANRRLFNLSACGSGKTLPAVMAIQALYAGDAVRRFLAIAPLSVIRATWVDHMERFAPDVPVTLLDVASKRRKTAKDLEGFEGVVLVNPDGMKTIFHELKDWKPELIVIDELAGYYRNTRTDRWKSLAALDALCKPAMWGFTGTPVTNDLMDAYAQIMLVNPGMLPRTSNGRPISFLAFRDMLCVQPYPSVWVPKKDALDRVYKMMQPAVRFTREQVMSDLKEPIRLRKDIPLTPEQKKLHAAMVAQGKAQYGDQTIKGTEAQALATKLTQIATGSVYDSKGEPLHIPIGPRIEALFDLRREVENTPLIVAVPFVHVARRLEEEIAGRGYAVEVIIGEVKPGERGDIVERFQAGKVDFLLCHPKTLAHGVTLTRSHTIVWFGPLYDLELYAQLNDRIFRYGQKEQPLIVEFCSTPGEARIYSALRNKERLAGNFLALFG